MEFLKKTFWTLLIICLIIVAWKLVPIFYHSIAIKSICKDNADRFFRYNKNYIMGTIDYDLKKLGIPRSNRQHNLTETPEGVYVEIYFEETADFFGYYQKKFEFYHECRAAEGGVY